MLIEVIVKNVNEAILAERYGADRLELIHDFSSGGLSPTFSLSKAVCAAVQIPVSVMLRPQSEHVVSDPKCRRSIFEEMENLCEHTQAKGIVFGALTVEGQVDVALLEEIIKHKQHLTLTFHRAIDVAPDPLGILNTLLSYPIDRILTSGGKTTALEGCSVIKQMVEKTKHTVTRILAGSGINPENASTIIETTGVTEIHLGTGLRTANVLDEKKFQVLYKKLNLPFE